MNFRRLPSGTIRSLNLILMIFIPILFEAKDVDVLRFVAITFVYILYVKYSIFNTRHIQRHSSEVLRLYLVNIISTKLYILKCMVQETITYVYVLHHQNFRFEPHKMGQLSK